MQISPIKFTGMTIRKVTQAQRVSEVGVTSYLNEFIFISFLNSLRIDK